MKILMAVGRFPKLSETPMLNQVTGLLDHGHEVRIYAHHEGELDPVHALVKEYDLLSLTSFYEPPADRDSFDVVIAQFGPRSFEFFDFPGKLATCFRGYDISRQLRRKKQGYYDGLWERGDLFLPVCRYFQERLVTLGCPADKIEVLHSAIDCRKFRFQPRHLATGDPVRIISVGRLVEKKGFIYALECIAGLAARGVSLEYNLIGHGPLEDELRDRIRELGIGEIVRFPGPLAHEDVVKNLETSHICLMPSVTAEDGNQEGIPNVLKEAMAMGLPVVSTRHAGIPELVQDGVSGYLVAERDSTALATALLQLIERPQQWGAMGQAGRVMIEKEFAVDGNYAKLESLLEKLLS